MDPQLTEKQQAKVVNALKECLVTLSIAS